MTCKAVRIKMHNLQIQALTSLVNIKKLTQQFHISFFMHMMNDTV